ncbi:MAG: hypothetical protein LIV11_09160 [Bacillota bacterium]|nr:hypothetical protein [Bacillota bacterium]
MSNEKEGNVPTGCARRYRENDVRVENGTGWKNAEIINWKSQ